MIKIIAALAAALLGATAAQAQDFDPMPMADTDGSGKVSLTEFLAFRETGWGFFAQGADSMKMVDVPPMAAGAFKGVTPDANGVVTHAAYTAAGEPRFKEADKDHDNALSAEELRATIE